MKQSYPQRARTLSWHELDRLVLARGWAVQCCPRDEHGNRLSFAYTVGLHRSGLPELLVFCEELERAEGMLATLAQQSVLARMTGQRLAVTAGARLDTTLGLVQAVESPAKRAMAYCTYAHFRSKGKASYLQLCLPDAEGRLPWQHDCDLAFMRRQPVLGQPGWPDECATAAQGEKDLPPV